MSINNTGNTDGNFIGCTHEIHGMIGNLCNRCEVDRIRNKLHTQGTGAESMKSDMKPISTVPPMAIYQFSNQELMELQEILRRIITLLPDSVFEDRCEVHLNTINSILAARNTRG